MVMVVGEPNDDGDACCSMRKGGGSVVVVVGRCRRILGVWKEDR